MINLARSGVTLRVRACQKTYSRKVAALPYGTEYSVDLGPIQKSTVRVRRENKSKLPGRRGFGGVVAKKPSEPVKGTRSSLSVRLEAVRYLNASSARRTVP